jgi:predicted nucleic acid-binding protein
VPPIVVTEPLSVPPPTAAARRFITTIPLLPIVDGYWERAGELRYNVRAQKKAAGLGDCLIAQSCIDNDIPLITYDLDFRHFEPAGLKLA